MTQEDNAFFEEYKRLDRLCSDMYSTPGGVSQYILDMENHFFEGAWLVDNWKQTYGELKHLRWVRNKIAHEAAGSSISCDHDLKILHRMTANILRQEDSLALLHREQYRRSNQMMQKEYSVEKKRHETINKNACLPGKRRSRLLPILILLILSTAAIVFAVYLSIE